MSKRETLNNMYLYEKLFDWRDIVLSSEEFYAYQWFECTKYSLSPISLSSQLNFIIVLPIIIEWKLKISIHEPPKKAFWIEP